jgi:hypothetical protein
VRWLPPTCGLSRSVYGHHLGPAAQLKLEGLGRPLQDQEGGLSTLALGLGPSAVTARTHASPEAGRHQAQRR